jgi:hypothetical protein
MHIHEWSPWHDIASIETSFHHGGSIIQTSHCLKCGKRKLRKTNSICSANVCEVSRVLDRFIAEEYKNKLK